LSHYGTKASRQKGFLTPSIEFTLGGNTNTAINTPYYYPVNESLDITLTPKFYLDSEFRFLESYYLNTLVNQKTSGGHIKLDIENIKNENNDNINTSFKLNTKTSFNKNTILSANGFLQIVFQQLGL
jgi:lipopolysaccharide assembly outer membrane protein LptD (OstA)